MSKVPKRNPQTATACSTQTLVQLRKLKRKTGKTIIRILADAVDEVYRREFAEEQPT